MQEYKKDLGKVVMTPAGKWDISKSYDLLCLVYEDITERSYISKQYVPTGVDLQDSRYWMPLNVSGYSDSNIIIFNQKDENGNVKSYSLEEAINKIAEVGRKPGAIIGFYHKDENRLDIGGRWELWQFDDNNIYNWNNLNHWTNIYYNYNKFVGWFRAENVLNIECPKPEIGCYAFVGSIYNESIIYRCDIKGKWTKINELAQHYIKVIVGGNISIGDNGNWYQDGKDTGVPASIKGDNGKTPYIRNNNNVLEYSYNEIDWFPISDKVAAWFRWKDNKIQISRDKVIWDDLSDQFQVNIHIKGYVASFDLLPSGQPIGTVYGVGPTYIMGAEDDPIYRIYVYTSNGWIDNGIFKGISAGVVQERGNSTTEVMSQDAVTKELTELESESYKEIFGGDTYTEINDEKALISEKEVNRTYIRIKNSLSNFRVKGTMAQGYAIAFFVSSMYTEGADIYSTAWLTEIDFSIESKGYLWAKVKKTNDAAITSSEAINAWNSSNITILENKDSRITKSEQWIETNKELGKLLINGEDVNTISPTFIENAYWSTDGNAPASASGYYAVSSLIKVSKGDKIRLYNWNLASAASQGAFAFLYDESKTAIGQRLNSDIPIREDSYMEYEITNELASYIGLDYLGTPKSGATIHIIRNAPKINPEFLPSQLQSKTVDLIMFMGQSNMAGRGVTSALFPSSYPMSIEGSGYEYRAITNPSELNNITEPFGKNENIVGAINDGNDKTGSMVTAFINAYYSITKVPVVGVSASEGGTLISQWQPNGARLDDAINRLSLAVSYLTTNGFTIRHKYMVWCQGESDGDSNSSAEDYTNMFNAMFNAMKSHGIEKCFLVRIGKYNGGGASDYSTIINAQTEICKNNYDVIMASTALASFKDDGLMKDAFHYYQEGYNRIGSYAGENVGLYVIGGKEPIMYDATTEGLYFSRWSY